MSNWALKRAEHYNAAQPPAPTITILAATKPGRTKRQAKPPK
jgi:hypothetical protein